MNNKNIIDVITEKIRRADDEYDLLSGRKHILAGLSGGADSCALVFALLELREKYGYELSAVHVNHGIRGKEADDDEKFARRLCSEHNIRFYCERADVPSVCKETGLSLETAARNVRYKIFENICIENNIDCVATAHTASDNVETVLFNLFRGCALSGICGIPAKRKLGQSGIDIIRPLLYVSRSLVEEYLEFLHHDFVVDSTNLLTDCSRNFIRHEIVPKIRSINPQIEDSLSNFVSNVTADKEFISDIADKMYTDDIFKLSKMDDAVAGRIVQQMYREEETDEMLENIHVKTVLLEIKACANGEKVRSSVSLPSKKRFVIDNGTIKICPDTRIKTTKPVEYDFVLQNGINAVEGAQYLVIVSDKECEFESTVEYDGGSYNRLDSVCLSFDKDGSVLRARNRRPGDTFFFRGMNRSVKKLLSESDISIDRRNCIPFITSDDSIAYIPCVGVGDKYTSKNNITDNVLNVSVYMIQE